MNQEICKNCHQVHQGNFCSNCGQKTKTARLNWHYIKDEANYTFLHFNKGFMFTVKELFTRPGDSIREFLQGKRIKHYKPLLLVFVLAGINGYLSMKLDVIGMMKQYQNTQSLNAAAMAQYQNAMHWFFEHYALFEIVALPIVSFASWLSFKKWGYNFIENIIINAFATGQRLIFSTFCLLLYFLIPNEVAAKISVITGLITFGLTIWIYATLYKDKEGSALFLRILLFLFLLAVIFFVLIIVFGIAFAVYLHKTGKI